MPCFVDVDSPIGPLRLVAEDGALIQLRLQPGPRSAALARGWREDGSAAPLSPVAAQLREYFAGIRREFDVPLRLAGSDFQQQVWAALRAIPYGATRGYGEIAVLVGNPGGSRAVGLANNQNPIPIIVPCHRVINADGSLGGFGGGVGRKQWLLQHEGAPAGAQQSLAL
jgi:methylated-DNA-[protein]-cysteine S-methyltransferase